MKWLLKPHQRPRYLRFQYKPRFWDPQKERVEALKRQIQERQAAEEQKELDKELLKERVRKGLRHGRSPNKFERRTLTQRENRKSNLRLFLILIALLWLTYKLLLVYL